MGEIWWIVSIEDQPFIKYSTSYLFKDMVVSKLFSYDKEVEKA